MRYFTILMFLLTASIALAQNDVLVGPGYQRDQRSTSRLKFSVPEGWIEDKKAAEKVGIFSVLLPRGRSLENSDRVITIAFQKRDPNVPELATLDAFFKADVENTLHSFPELEAARWQPKALDPAKIDFRSLEFFGGKASPHRVVFLAVPDGFFSVTVTVEPRDALKAPLYATFFDSLKIGGPEPPN